MQRRAKSKKAFETGRSGVLAPPGSPAHFSTAESGVSEGAQPRCPKCSAEDVRRVSRHGVKERLESVFSFYPFRCQLCGTRFKFRLRGVKCRRIEIDHREYERLDVRFPVSFTGKNISGAGIVTDLSMGGCTFFANALLHEGDILLMTLTTARGSDPIVVGGMVRNASENRVGVEFLKLGERERERFRMIIRDHSRQSPGDMITSAECRVNSPDPST